MNTWDQRFKQQEYVYGTEANEFIREQASRFPTGSTIAAYAEGEGRNAVYVASLGHNVTAYDYAQSGLDKTEALAKAQNVHVQTKLVDLIEEPLLTEKYDGAIMVFGHFPKEKQYAVLDKIIASLKPGGIFMFEVYEDQQLAYGTGGPKDVEWLYNGRDVLAWAQQFNLVHFFIGEATRHEGQLHTGKCYVVQVVVKK
ncbi:class I SAM-dependent methyltransferase [Lysinibacillus sp. LZ02]|uniref:class I SAM-dependent methyltransferase n=1 Tax=Lysinibacillus sp. LZ02 TaxID=3420668 RepID=UPI003D36E609